MLKHSTFLIGTLIGTFSLFSSSENYRQKTGVASRTRFEVTSIKANGSGSPAHFIDYSDPSRLRVTNEWVKELIEFAYEVQAFQISGGPAWINSSRYDIDAKVDDSIAAEFQKLPIERREVQMRLMLQSLLADRFGLRLGYRTKEVPVYTLVVAKSGPKLTPAASSSAAPADGRVSSAHQGPMIMTSVGRIAAKDMPLSSLAEVLERQPELGSRLVVDQTGLKGKYDFTLQFAPDGARLMHGANSEPSVREQALTSSGPSIFTAIQEQLGLKLELAKGAVQTLVIENIEQPSEN